MVTTRIRTHLTYANVMSTIAVFVVLGGGAYAATKLPKNSVGTAQIKNKAVTKAKLAKGLAIAGPKGAPGPKGDKGDPGTNGTNGINGKDGTNGKDGNNGVDGADAATNLRYVLASSGGLSTNTGSATATCNQPGEKMISGGGGFVQGLAETVDKDSAHIVSWSGPVNGSLAAADPASATGWMVAGANTSAVAARIYAYAICASP